MTERCKGHTTIVANAHLGTSRLSFGFVTTNGGKLRIFRDFGIIAKFSPLAKVGISGITIVAIVPSTVFEHEIVHTIGFVATLVVGFAFCPVQVFHRLTGAPFPLG